MDRALDDGRDGVFLHSRFDLKLISLLLVVLEKNEKDGEDGKVEI